MSQQKRLLTVCMGVWLLVFVSGCSGSEVTSQVTPTLTIPRATPEATQVLEPTPTVDPFEVAQGNFTPASLNNLELRGHWGSGVIADMTYSRDGGLFAAVTNIGVLYVFDARDYSLVSKIATGLVVTAYDSLTERYENTTCDYCGGLSISPENEFVAIVAADGTIGLVGLPNGEVRKLYFGNAEGLSGELDFGEEGSHSFDVGFGADSSIIYVFEYGGPYGAFRTSDGALLFLEYPVRSGGGVPELASPSLGCFFGRNRFQPGTIASRKFIYGYKWDNWVYNDVPSAKNNPLAISPNCQWIVLDETYPTYEPGRLRVLQIESGVTRLAFDAPQPRIQGDYYSINSMAEFAWAGDLLIIINQYSLVDFWERFSLLPTTGRIEVWDLTSESKRGELELPALAGGEVAVKQDASQAAIAVGPATVEIVTFDGGLVASLDLDATCAGPAFVVSPRGDLFASYYANSIQVCSTADGHLVDTFYASTGRITDLAFSPDGKFLASSGFSDRLFNSSQREYDPIVYLWDVSTGEVVKTYKGHHGSVGDIQFTPDGRVLLAAGGNRFTLSNKGCPISYWTEVKDAGVIAWEVQTGQQLWAQEGPVGGSFDMEVSDSGNSVAVLNAHCKDYYVWVYDANTGQILKKMYSGEYARWSDIEFSPSGENILVRGYSLLSLDIQSGEEAGGEDLQGRYIIYPDSIDVAFDSELAVVVRDNDIYFLCFEPQTCTVEYPVSEFVEQIAFVPGKQMLLGLGEHRGVVTVWGSQLGDEANSNEVTASPQLTPGVYPPKDLIQENVVYLADLEPAAPPRVGWGEFSAGIFTVSSPNELVFAGETIHSHGFAYTKGLVAHAWSEVRYNLEETFGQFSTELMVYSEGLSDCGDGVLFQVYVDDTLLYESPPISSARSPIAIAAPMIAGDQLRLVVDERQNVDCDLAIWGNPALLR